MIGRRPFCLVELSRFGLNSIGSTSRRQMEVVQLNTKSNSRAGARTSGGKRTGIATDQMITLDKNGSVEADISFSFRIFVNRIAFDLDI